MGPDSFRFALLSQYELQQELSLAPFHYPATMRIARAALATLMIVALAACSHAMPSDPERGATRGPDSDPWRVKGSVTAGPMSGTPQGPYGARP
jgi:hypothetical protein